METVPAEKAMCACQQLPTSSKQFTEVRRVGTDTTKGRYGSVKVQQCVNCGQLWLHYDVEYAAFSKSGRWYRGAVTPEVAESVTPETAVAVLERLPSYIYGGSYFDSPGKRGSGEIDVDL